MQPVLSTDHLTHGASLLAVTVPPSPAMAPGDISRIIEMAWEDRTPFEDIEREYGLNESAVTVLMRREMKASSFRMWRKRMTGRTTKHRVVQQERVLAMQRGNVVTGGENERSILAERSAG